MFERRGGSNGGQQIIVNGRGWVMVLSSWCGFSCKMTSIQKGRVGNYIQRWSGLSPWRTENGQGEACRQTWIVSSSDTSLGSADSSGMQDPQRIIVVNKGKIKKPPLVPDRIPPSSTWLGGSDKQLTPLAILDSFQNVEQPSTWGTPPLVQLLSMLVSSETSDLDGLSDFRKYSKLDVDVQ